MYIVAGDNNEKDIVTNNSDIIAKIWFIGGLKLRFKDYC